MIPKWRNAFQDLKGTKMSAIFKRVQVPLLACFAFMLLLHAQDQTGFISIDCGLAENSTYSEKKTTITYISDAAFIDTGEIKLVLPENRNNYQPYWSLRSFPEGTRNCYNIDVKNGTRYLVRASFFYGNYDGENKLPKFELYLGPNFWDSVSLADATSTTDKELIHYVSAKINNLQVCVVKTGSWVPFISAIELRPLPFTTYQTQTGSLALYGRFDTGQIEPDLVSYRYPFDMHDRFWYAFTEKNWTQLSTSSTIDLNQNDFYQPGSEIMRTAAVPKLATDDLKFYWVPTDENEEFYVYLHFAEIEELPANQSRQLEITRNGELFHGPFAPIYLTTLTVWNIKPMTGQFNFSVRKGDVDSDLQPILNAIEIFTVKEFSEQVTDQDDGSAITQIKAAYKIEKNWQGDPCLPKNYSWEGLNCTYPPDDSPRIIHLDLSSSKLTGEIDGSISALKMLQTLDLSNNNLTGPIPDFMSQMSNLNALNLGNNKFTGSVPSGLTERAKNGLLSLSLCDNPNLSGNVPCIQKKKKKSVVIPIIGSIIGVSVLLLAVAIIFWRVKRKKQHGATIVAQPLHGLVDLEPKRRQFTFAEILKMTNNRQRILGKGGFGTVYHGYIDDNTQVAVKLLSSSSSQGLEQFHAEVNLLMRVHHTNLTSLVGYCDDENNKGLVYEYMARGNLQEYLSDKNSNFLTWDGRLQVAADAAQGLEYLHNGCKPPMIHRDIKTTNILLSESFQAKLSDFGLSRNFPADDGTHIFTGVAGTPGYLAPEYKQQNRLNEKSDVYSFGIVLLEIITGRPAVSRTRERIAIDAWVGSIIPKGDIDAIVDPSLKGFFSVSSAWKIVETAMECVSPDANKRPNMSKVVGELKQCLETQSSERNQSITGSESGNSFELVSGNSHSISMMRPSVR